MGIMTWLTRGPLADRFIFMSNADSAAAIANGWASATPLEWKTSDAAAIAARDANADLGAAANWYEKMGDPRYTVAIDDAGSYTPPAEGAFTNITLSPSTVDDAAGANTVVGTITVTGGNLPITLSISPADAKWNISGTQLRKANAGSPGYVVGPMTVGVKATGEDGESFTKTLTVTVT